MRYVKNALLTILTIAVIGVCGALPWIAGLIDDRSRGLGTEPVREMRLDVRTGELDVLDKLAMLCQEEDEGYLIEGGELDGEELEEAEEMVGAILEVLAAKDLIYEPESDTGDQKEKVTVTRNLKLIIDRNGTARSFMFYTFTLSAGRTVLNMQIDRDTGALLSCSFMPATLRAVKDNEARLAGLVDWFSGQTGAPDAALTLSGPEEGAAENSYVYVHEDPYTGYMSWVSEDYGRCIYEIRYRNGSFTIKPLPTAGTADSGQTYIYGSEGQPGAEE